MMEMLKGWSMVFLSFIGIGDGGYDSDFGYLDR